MTSYSAAVSEPVIAAYDFSPFARIADIGGGNGRFIADILAANPSARGIVFDLPNVAAGTAALFESGAAERCELVAGDFFERVPSGADAYLLKKVIHDWDDARAIAILLNCRRAMGSAAKLLLVECVMPEKAEHGRSSDEYLLDLEMLVHTPGGRERTEAEFRSILTAARFALTRIVSTPAPVYVIEARPV